MRRLMRGRLGVLVRRAEFLANVMHHLARGRGLRQSLSLAYRTLPEWKV